MSLKKYDEAVKAKLEAVFPNVLYSDDDQAPANYSSEKSPSSSEKTEEVIMRLPLISFYRMNNPFALDQFGVDSHIRRGRYVIEPDRRLKAFPINIQYQIDIWSDRRVEVDDIWRELVQFIYEDPIIKVYFDDSEVPLDYDLTLIDTDNTTDLSSFNDRGRLYRQTINVEVRQAQLLFSEEIKPVREIPVRIVPVRLVPSTTEEYDEEIHGD